MVLDNWRTILNNAYSVRFSLAAAVSSLVIAWQTKDPVAIIPAVLAVGAIVARIIPQKVLRAQEELSEKVIGEIK